MGSSLLIGKKKKFIPFKGKKKGQAINLRCTIGNQKVETYTTSQNIGMPKG